MTAAQGDWFSIVLASTRDGGLRADRAGVDGARAEQLPATWTDLATAPAMQAVLGVVVLCILIAAAVYLVSGFRDYAADDRLEPEPLGSNFLEMLRRGDITEAEYRMIQSKSNGDSMVVTGDSPVPAGQANRGHDDASRKDC